MAIHLNEQMTRYLERLQAIANRKNHSLEDLLSEVVHARQLPDWFDEGEEPVDDFRGSGLKLAQAVKEMNYYSGQPDFAEHSREILEKDFTDELFERMNQDTDKISG